VSISSKCKKQTSRAAEEPEQQLCKKQTSRAAEEPEQQLCTLQSNTKLQAGSGIAALQEGSKRGIGSLPSDEDELIFNFKRVTAQG